MQCFCATARRVARRLTRTYELELREAGVNPSQFEVLQYLKARPGVSQAMLAEAMDVDQTTLSRNVKLLVQLGWVVAAVGVSDRRLATYALSRAGAAKLAEALPLWRKANAKVRQSITDEREVWRVLGALEQV